jgi:hypothetical protein
MTPISVLSYLHIADVPVEWDDLTAENPFLARSALAALEQTNPCGQRYHIVQQAVEQLALVTYQHRLNILTLGRGRLSLPVTIVGVPCSVSRCGFAPSDAWRLLGDWLPTTKGVTVALNCHESVTFKEAVCNWTLPSCRLNICWANISDYKNSLRSGYRRRLNKALTAWNEVEVNQLSTGLKFDETLYNLYAQVYERSEFKLERLGIDFFRQFPSTIHVCRVQGKAIAFFQTVDYGSELIFLLGGMDYAQRDRYDIYFNLLFEIIRYAINHGYTSVDLGQTAEETKMRFGCTLLPKRFVASHSNRLIKGLAQRFSDVLGYSLSLPEYNIFKEIQ